MSVRWDAAVGDSCFWSEPPVEVRQPPLAGESVEVRVWPFGILAASNVSRPIILNLTQGFTLRTVIAGLKARFGDDFLDSVLDGGGGLISQCRVFVEGCAVENLDSPLPAKPQANIEIILLVAIEGG